MKSFSILCVGGKGAAPTKQTFHHNYSVGTPMLCSQLCIKIHILTLDSVGALTLLSLQRRRADTVQLQHSRTDAVMIIADALTDFFCTPIL